MIATTKNLAKLVCLTASSIGFAADVTPLKSLADQIKSSLESNRDWYSTRDLSELNDLLRQTLDRADDPSGSVPDGYCVNRARQSYGFNQEEATARLRP